MQKIMLTHIESLLTHLRPEAQLLLDCARTQLEASTANRIVKRLQTDIDWSYLLGMAYRHNLGPLLYRSLEAVAPNTVPEAVRAELKARLQIDIQNSLFLTKELQDLLALFNRHNLLVLPYKGPVLATSVYHELALRPFSDLDILVRERDILPAMDVLTACGYEIIRPLRIAQAEKKIQSRRVKQLVEKSPWAYQLVLAHPDRHVVVELHWRIAPKYIFPNDSDPLWQDLSPVSLGKTTVLSFAPENLLWFLGVHGAKHQWQRLNWLCDLAELMRVYPHLNWDQIVAQATQLGIERRLYLGLLLAHCLLATPLPQAIERKIQTTPQVKALAQQVIEKVFDDAGQTATGSHLQRLAFQLRAIDRVVDRGRYLWRFAYGSDSPTPAGQAGVTSLSSLPVFSSLHRPLRLVKTYSLSPLRRLFKVG